MIMYVILLKGYAAGGAIPSPQKNVEKDLLKKYWARWKASHVGRWYVICLNYIYILLNFRVHSNDATVNAFYDVLC